MAAQTVVKMRVRVADPALDAYCPDLADWAMSWRYDEGDVVPGQRIVECLTPFLMHLLSRNLSPRTLRRHRDNLWMLGGELIGALWETPKHRSRPIEELITSAVDDDGGPWLSHHESEAMQRSFDSTCRMLHRFLQTEPSPSIIPRPVGRTRKGVKGTVPPVSD